MGVQKIVFGSSMEKRCFQKLSETWGKEYHIYHNLPFLNVFAGKTDLMDDDFEPFTLSDEEYDLLKKTSIDFTLCDKKDKPLVCIEFDGLQDGFNIAKNYHLRSGSPGRRARRLIMELKLRVAHGSQFPYLVLGSEEFRGLSEAVRLTIADGLIGEVMSVRAAHERIQTVFDPTQCGISDEDFSTLPPAEQHEIIGDWVAMVEIESEFTHNPIVRRTAELFTELKATGYRVTFLKDEQHDPDEWACLQCEVTNSAYGSATARICLPDFKTPFCYYTAHVAQEICQLLALEQLRRRRAEKRARRT